MLKENIEIKVFDKDNSLDDKLLQGIVDLYEDGFDDEEKKSRGISSVEILKEEIKNKVLFIIAINKENNEIIGAGKLNFYDEKEKKVIWSNSIRVKKGEDFRKKGIGRMLLEKADAIVAETREEFD